MSSKGSQRGRWWKLDASALAVALLLTGGVYMVGYKPLLDRHAQVARQQQELITAQQELKKLDLTRTSLKSQLLKVNQAVEAGTLRLQGLSHLNQRVAAITALAQDHALRVDEVQPGAVTGHEYYDAVPIHLAGSGQYRQCAAFLHTLGERFIDTAVAAFEINGFVDQPDRPADFTFTLTWHAAPSVSPASATAEVPTGE